jgi:hypothetical protein
MTIAGLRLGRPGIYPAPELPDRSLRPVRLDVAGFVGVAPRGPVDTPVLVRSWSDYQLRFGTFEGAGLLPYAVSVFFDQGGERAYVVRVGGPGPRPEPALDEDRALLELQLRDDEALRFVAANPGKWGSGLTIQLGFDATPQLPLQTMPGSDGPSTRVVVPPKGQSVPVGSLLRIRGPEMPALGAFFWVDSTRSAELQNRRVQVAELDRPVPHRGANDVPLMAGVVTATLSISDGDRAFSRLERLTGLGLDPAHPEPLAVAVADRSLLVFPVGEWTSRRLLPPDALLTPVSKNELLRAGRDVDESISLLSFFDERPELDPDDEPYADGDIAAASADHPNRPSAEHPNRLRGATGLAQVPEVGLLAMPDLFWDWVDQQPLTEVEDAHGCPTFQDCQPAAMQITYRGRSKSVLLDAGTSAGLTEILQRQSQLVDLAERHRRFVALLDVPQRLDIRGIARWRASFDSSYAAAYHPWLEVVRDTGATQAQVAPLTDPLIRTLVDSISPDRQQVPPSAFAAGIIAARELRLGLPWGPANELAAGAVFATAAVTAAEHDMLHPLGINVYRAERDGYRLTAARTLSQNAYLRQLSVRRLLTMLRLALDRQMQWVVFEPNTAALRELLRHTLLAFLRQLYRAGAFVGESEEQAFFVRVDDSLNPLPSLALGRLVIEVGVAPAEPVEFIVLRITRDGDGGVRVEERGSDG